MIIFLVWYFSFLSLYHSISKVIFIFIRILILLILPISWYHNTIIPEIITYSITKIISFILIPLFILWYLSLSSYLKYIFFLILLFIFFYLLFLLFIIILNICIYLNLLWLFIHKFNII